MPRGGKSRKQDQAVAALLGSSTIGDAAESCGMGTRTLKRWLKRPEFLEAYKEAQRELLESAVNRLRGAALEFVDALHHVATDAAAPPAARATAARSGLEVLLKASGLEEMERRIAELERAVAGDKR